MSSEIVALLGVVLTTVVSPIVGVIVFGFRRLTAILEHRDKQLTAERAAVLTETSKRIDLFEKMHDECQQDKEALRGELNSCREDRRRLNTILDKK